MDGKYIEMVFKPESEGGTTIEAVNFNGNGCEMAVNQMADRLGVKLLNVEQKPEYFEDKQSATEKEMG